MILLVKVECSEGEESIYISEVSQEDLYNLGNILESIKENSGYFPTGIYHIQPDPSPFDLYGGFPGFNDFLGRLPNPPSGIKRISEIVLADPVSTLYM
jgi:hypothetical protein